MIRLGNKMVNLKSVVEALEIDDDDELDQKIFSRKEEKKADNIISQLITYRFEIKDDKPLSELEKIAINDLNENPDKNVAIYQPTNVAQLKTVIINAINYLGDDGNYNWIDTSHLSSLNSLFKGLSKFNGDITKWDTSNVVNMLNTFSGASSFDRDLSGWNVENVKYISSVTFSNCKQSLIACFKAKQFPNKITNFT